MLCADGRHTSYDDDSNVIDYRDGFSKVQQWQHGLVTGSGFSELIHAVEGKMEPQVDP